MTAMDKDTPPVGPRIRARRRELDISQADLAGRLGLHQTTVAKWETGERSISLSDLIRVCRELDLSVEAVTSETAA